MKLPAIKSPLAAFGLIIALATTTISPFAAQSSELSKSEYQDIAETAYVYGYPMLVAYQVLYDYFVDKDSGSYKAPINELASEARVYSPADTAVRAPNSDTPYSFVQLDLRAEPMVICVPEIEESRYYDVQLSDMYTNNYGYIGSRATGNAAGCFMVAGSGWSGDTPDGIKKVFQSDTDFTFTVFRTQLFGPSDMPNVEKIQAGYSVKALSAFLGSNPPAAAPEIDWPEPTGAMFSTEFPKFLNFLFQFTPATAVPESEQNLREQFAEIGIGAGKSFDMSTLSTEQQSALAEGITAANAMIGETAASAGTPVNGWQIGALAGSREFYDGDWAKRAAASKLGIYGNDAEEAVYPFARNDVNDVPLDGTQHAYTMTFPADGMPPVNAFWSVTMYDGETSLLIDNPIDRYLVNSSMLPDLKKNPDGSLTIWIQHESPGTDRESNWLPAPAGSMFIVMRLYWPKTEDPSVLPPGEGSWSPPGIVPVTNEQAQDVTRFGDKSLETVIRTDERYGGDPFFQGPRGWPYWNYLEYAKPIQNPNLWPDMQSTYFLSRLAMPAGSTLTLRGPFPRARYFKLALYKAEHGTFVSIGEALAGPEITSDPGSTNPFVVGADRLEEPRDYTVTIVAEEAPDDPKDRAPNTLYAGADGGVRQLILRIYLSDQGSDGAGWGAWASASNAYGLPTLEGTLPDGTRVTGDAAAAAFGRPFQVNTAPPLSAAQWTGLVNSKDNDPSLDPATAPARETPHWQKYWNFRYSIAGSFMTPEDQAKIPYAGPIDGGGDPATQYLFVQLSRQFGPVFVTRGKMPTFPDTYSGAAGLGLETMPPAQIQYWSVVSGESVPSGQIVDGLSDMQVPLDEDGNYVIVLSRNEDRPTNATAENGVAWIEWSPLGEGLDTPQNRSDYGIMMMRIMAPSSDWAESPANITEPGKEEEVMGPYYPEGEYMTKEAFEALGSNP